MDVLSRELSFLQQRLSDISSLTEHSKKEKFTAITKEGDEAEDDTMMVCKNRNALIVKRALTAVLNSDYKFIYVF